MSFGHHLAAGQGLPCSDPSLGLQWFSRLAYFGCIFKLVSASRRQMNCEAYCVVTLCHTAILYSFELEG